MPNPFLALDATTSITIQGVQVWDEAAVEDLNSANPSATRTLVCAWGDRLSLLAALGGGYNPKTGLFDPPQSYPMYPWLWVVAAPIEPIAGPDGPTCDTVAGQQIIGYQWARMRVRYARVRIDPLNINRGDLKINFSDELIAPSRDTPAFQFADGTPLPAGDTPAIRVAKAAFTLTRYNLSGLPLSILNLKSCVNAAAFDFAIASCSPMPAGLTNLIANTPGIAGTRCPPGTLLMNNIGTDKPLTIGGTDQISGVFELIYRACGWNSVWNVKAAQFEPIYTLPPTATPGTSANGVTGTGTAADPYTIQGCVYISGATPPVEVTPPTPGMKVMYPAADFSPLYNLL